MEAGELSPIARRGAADREADEVDGEEAAAPDHVGSAERDAGRGERCDRSERTDRAWQPCEHPGRRHGEHDADDEAETELSDDEQHELVEPLRFGAFDPRDQADRQRDGHRVVAARLGFERPREPAPDLREAERREHRCGVGRRHYRAEQDRLEPRQVEEHLRRDAGEYGGHDDADRAQECRRYRYCPQPAPRRLQSALEQDQDEADDPDLASELGVVEIDPARAVGAEEHPERQEGDQKRYARASRAQRDQHARREHRADEEENDAFVHADILAARGR